MIRSRASRPLTEGRCGTSNRRCRRGHRMIGGALTLFMLLSATAVAQSGPPPTDADVTSQSVRSRPEPHLARWWQSIGWGILLLVILVASASAVVVFSRRYGKYLRSESRKPTPIDDVWTMHKLTDSQDPDRETDEGADTSPDED